MTIRILSFDTRTVINLLTENENTESWSTDGLIITTVSGNDNIDQYLDYASDGGIDNQRYEKDYDNCGYET